MSLWFVPAAVAAAGMVPATVMVLRVLEELARLRAEMARVAGLRPAVVELGAGAAALSARAEALPHRQR